MILAVDIGNTNISIGGFQGKKLVSHFCIDNKSLIQKKVSLPLKSSFLNRFKNILIASVNPKMESFFYKYLDKRYKKMALKIGREIKLKIPTLVENQEKVGIDRLLNALAAFKRTKTSTIVIDFGTAITFDVVSKRGEFLGGIILPGIKTSAYALNRRTAFLPEVEIKKPTVIIGSNTEKAICSGIYMGTVGATTHILKNIRKEFGGIRYTIATGGDSKIFKEELNQIDMFIPHLTLEGIRIAFAENFNS
ncbi:MAG: type III pantothenate kinase [Candidatus Scalinduaceae bacterium]